MHQHRLWPSTLRNTFISTLWPDSGASVWIEDWVCLILPILLVVIRQCWLIGLAVLVATVGRHPLMVADKRGAFRATRVRAGRIWGLSRWGLVCQPLPPLPTCGLNVHNEDGRETRSSSPTKEERLQHQKCSLIAGQLGEIRHWHLAFVWWPEIERLDFRCLELNCTAGMQLTGGGKHEWIIQKKGTKIKHQHNYMNVWQGKCIFFCVQLICKLLVDTFKTKTKGWKIQKTEFKEEAWVPECWKIINHIKGTK